MSIKLRLEQNDPEFKYRRYIIQKFFSCDKKTEKTPFAFGHKSIEDSSMDVQSKHFRIYY